MEHPTAYRDKEVVVLGLARSGQAVAKLFGSMGAKVVANDLKPQEQCPEAEDLQALGISVICGSHPPSLIHDGVALLVKNPGIPYTAAPVQAALSLGIEVVTEVEVAYHLSRAPIIGITGSNGKTTTTTWVGVMLEQAGLRPVVAGNIGRALSEVCDQVREDEWLIAELSSFQLKGTVQFRPRIALLLNISETHLDYHGTMEDYVESKLRLFANQGPDDWAIINKDDDLCHEAAMRSPGKLMYFSTKQTLDYGVYVSSDESAEGVLIFRDEHGQTLPLCLIRDIGIPGRHNVENAAAAAAVALAAGADKEAIAEALRQFKGVEHRMEYVKHVEGVAFYNNSKATNGTATVKALETLDGNVILIAGGLDRGVGFDELTPWIREKVKAVVAMGETKEQWRKTAAQAGIEHIAVVEQGRDSALKAMEYAVQAAYAFAQAGDTILLSPACASWDMFTSYEERGSMFKNAVHNL